MNAFMHSKLKQAFRLGRMILTMSCLCAACGWKAAEAGDQPQWGERFTRNMVSAERGLAESFDIATGRNIKWRAKLGSETHSTPIVAGGRVYIGTNNGEPRDVRQQGDRGVFMCFEEKSGKFLWQLVVPKRDEDPYLDWPNSGIASPATVDGHSVYLVSNRGELLCLDPAGMADGNKGPFQSEGRHMTPRQLPEIAAGPGDADIVWMFDMVSGAGIYTHDGAHSSVLVDGPYLYLNTGTGVDNTHKKIRTPDAPSLIVVEKRTGRYVAREREGIAPDIFHCTWSSPSVGTVNGRRLVFFAGGNGVVYAFDAIGTNPPAGEVAGLQKVWQFDFDPAAPKHDIHSYLNNRREGPSDIFGMPVFYRNRIYIAGGGDVWWGKNSAWVKCIDATQQGDITKTGEVWSYPLQRHVMSTVAISDGLLFIADCGRTVHCLDAETGRPYWTHETKGEIWASPLVADGKVYIGTRRGDFWVFAASKEKKIFSSIELGSPISATATAANGVVYVATMKELYAIEKTN